MKRLQLFNAILLATAASLTAMKQIGEAVDYFAKKFRKEQPKPAKCDKCNAELYCNALHVE